MWTERVKFLAKMRLIKQAYKNRRNLKNKMKFEITQTASMLTLIHIPSWIYSKEYNEINVLQPHPI